MWKDPIVEEIHATRRRISAECNGDMNQIIARLRKHEKAHRERIVLPARAKAESQVEE